jgi:chromosome segregation protein
LVFQANGVVISGQGASGKRLGRTRRQSEIENEIAQISSQIDNLELMRTTISEKMDSLVEKRNRLTRELQMQEDQTNAARDLLQETRDRSSHLGEQISWNESQLETIQANIQKTRDLITAIENKLNHLDEEIEVKVNAEKVLRLQLVEIPLLEIQQSKNQWQTHKLVAENALAAARQRFEDHHQRVEEVSKRLSMYQVRLHEMEANLEEIQVNKAALKASMDQLNEKIATINKGEIDPLNKMSEDLEGQVSALENLQAHSHQQVMIAERHFTQLQLELSRREDQLLNLRERIEDDFGLVAFDYDPKIDGQTPLPFDESLIADLPRVETLPKSSEAEIKRLKGQIRRIGPINAQAQQEFFEVKERHEFLTNQIADLEKATDDLSQVIDELDALMERDFVKTFKSVNQEFSVYFARLFNGGEAKLVFSDEENPVEGGVDIEARLPGRRQQGLALLSGGERSLTAVALIFALLKVSPTPFCILDEVDAMLDESNVGRFVELLKELSKKIQFVIITHNRNTVQAADVIYGVTMGRDSTSQMISLKLEELDETYLE